MSAAASEQSLRSKWTHEDHLVNYRLTWLLVSQSLLFGAYGLLLNMLANPQGKPLEQFAEMPGKAARLLDILPYLGIVVSTLLLAGVVGAMWAMWNLLHKQRKAAPGERVDVELGSTILGWASALALPITFIWAWCWVLRI